MPIEWEVLRHVQYQASPWKNGGGVTREVLRWPVDSPQFDWRVSVAQIDRAGPFSDFQGYTRHMALLAGNGVRLRVAGDAHELRQPGDLLEFDGGAAVDCDLRDGSCTDLNLMVKTALPSSARVIRITAPASLGPDAGECAFLFALDPVQVFAQGTEPVHLGRWDSLFWSGGEACHVAPDANTVGAPSAVFFATIGHGRQSPAAPDRA